MRLLPTLVLLFALPAAAADSVSAKATEGLSRAEAAGEALSEEQPDNLQRSSLLQQTTRLHDEQGADVATASMHTMDLGGLCCRLCPDPFYFKHLKPYTKPAMPKLFGFLGRRLLTDVVSEHTHSSKAAVEEPRTGGTAGGRADSGGASDGRADDGSGSADVGGDGSGVGGDDGVYLDFVAASLAALAAQASDRAEEGVSDDPRAAFVASATSSSIVRKRRTPGVDEALQPVPNPLIDPPADNNFAPKFDPLLSGLPDDFWTPPMVPAERSCCTVCPEFTLLPTKIPKDKTVTRPDLQIAKMLNYPARPPTPPLLGEPPKPPLSLFKLPKIPCCRFCPTQCPGSRPWIKRSDPKFQALLEEESTIKKSQGTDEHKRKAMDRVQRNNFIFNLFRKRHKRKGETTFDRSKLFKPPPGLPDLSLGAFVNPLKMEQTPACKAAGRCCHPCANHYVTGAKKRVLQEYMRQMAIPFM